MRGGCQITNSLWFERPPPCFLHRPQHFAPRGRAEPNVFRHPAGYILLAMRLGDILIKLSRGGTLARTDHD